MTVAPAGAARRARGRRSADARIATDKPRYRVGERVTVDAALAGASGDAFVSFEGARALGELTVAAGGGHASAAFTVPETVGEAAIGVAFVRDGALEYATRPDRDRRARPRPRRPRWAPTAPAYAPGSVAHLTIADGGKQGRGDAGDPPGRRAADRRGRLRRRAGRAGRHRHHHPEPGLGRPGLARLGHPAPLDRAGLREPTSRAAPAAETLGAASERALFWKIDRTEREGFDVPVPQQPGRYVVSVLKISDDGDVGAATLALEVR